MTADALTADRTCEFGLPGQGAGIARRPVVTDLRAIAAPQSRIGPIQPMIEGRGGGASDAAATQTIAPALPRRRGAAPGRGIARLAAGSGRADAAMTEAPAAAMPHHSGRNRDG